MERFVIMRLFRSPKSKPTKDPAPCEVMPEGTTIQEAQYEVYRKNNEKPLTLFVRYSLAKMDLYFLAKYLSPSLEVLFDLGVLPPPTEIEVMDDGGTIKKRCSLKTTTCGEHKIIMSFGDPCDYYLEDMLAHRDKLKKMDALCIDMMGRNHRGSKVWLPTCELERVIELWKLRDWDWTEATKPNE